MRKLFGGIELTWPKVVVSAVPAGVITALIAMFAPEGTSVRRIAETPEAWVVMALLVVVNCKSPKDAALKVFGFFLISQPLVYLVEVLAGFADWGIFRFYGYWFAWTVAMLPAGYIGWHVKDGTVISAVLLSVLTIFQIWSGADYLRQLLAAPPTYLLATIFCFASVPFMIIGTLQKRPRLVCSAISGVALIGFVVWALLNPVYRFGAISIPLDTSRCPVDSSWEAKVEGGGPETAAITTYEGGGSLNMANIGKPGTYTVTLTGPNGARRVLTVTVTAEEDARYTIGYEDGTTERW